MLRTLPLPKAGPITLGNGRTGQGVGGALDLEDVLVLQLVYLLLSQGLLPVGHEYPAA